MIILLLQSLSEFLSLLKNDLEATVSLNRVHFYSKCFCTVYSSIDEPSMQSMSGNRPGSNLDYRVYITM